MVAKLKLYGVLLITILLNSVFFSCESTIGNLTSGKAYINIINASPDDSKVDFFINDTLKTVSPLAFGDSTGRLTVAGGSSEISTKLNGVIINKSKINLFLAENKTFTFFIAGKIAKDSLVYVSTENNLKPPKIGFAKVKFVNVSPNAPLLDVIFTLNATDSVPNFRSIGFRSGSAYQEFLPGNYTVKLRGTGKKISLIDIPGFNVVSGKIYTVWAKGTLKGTGNYALTTAMLSEN